MPPSIPNFNLKHSIGEGGFGMVWLAESVTGKARAIKVVERSHFEEIGREAGAIQELFELEFKGVQRFEDLATDCPQLISILHVGWLEGRESYYYVMPLADPLEHGSVIEYQPHTLDAELANRGHFSWVEVMGLIDELAKGAGKLHEAGLQHGDISSANILYIGEQAVLADPGLTCLLEDRRTARSVGYSDLHSRSGSRSDIFSLGRLCYHLLSGKHPADGFPILPVERQSEVPALEFAELLDCCCHPDPAERFLDAVELRQFLQSLRPVPKEEKGRSSRTKIVMFSIGALLLIGLAFFLMGFKESSIPDLARIENGRIEVFSESGTKLLWNQEVGGDILEAKVVDLDADGDPEILCAVAHLTPRGEGRLICFDSSGEIKWTFDSNPPCDIYKGYEGQAMGLEKMLVDDFDGKPGLEIILVCQNSFDWFPSALQFLNHDGEQYATYHHPGHFQVEEVRTIRPAPDVPPLLLCHAYNNHIGTPVDKVPLYKRKHTSCLMLLDPSVSGEFQSPPGKGQFEGHDHMARWYLEITPQFADVRYLFTEDDSKGTSAKIRITLAAFRLITKDHEDHHIQCDLTLDLDGNILEQRPGDGHRHPVGLGRLK